MYHSKVFQANALNTKVLLDETVTFVVEFQVDASVFKETDMEKVKQMLSRQVFIEGRIL